MDLVTLFSPSGRLSARPFAIAAVLVYVASLASQVLLADPITLRAGLTPFVLVQLILLWIWVALHAKRLHDCARGMGLAIGVGVIYALGVVLMLLLAELMVGATTYSTNGWSFTGADFLGLFVIFSLLGAFGDPDLGLFGLWVLAVLALVFGPMLIALAFSIWAGTRTALAPAT